MHAQIGFAGQCVEDNSGLYILGSRIFSPAARRFLAADAMSPLGAGGLNRYAYCSGDPLSRVDPSGYSWIDWLLSGAGAIAAIGGLVSALFAIPTGGASLMATLTLVGAAAAEAVSVVAEVGSMVAGVQGNDALQATFGWVALGFGLTAGGLGIASKSAGRAAIAAHVRQASTRDVVSPVRVGAEGSGGVDSLLPPRAVGRIVHRGADIPSARIEAMKVGAKWESRVIPQWRRFEDPARALDAVHWGADSEVSHRYIQRALPDIMRGRQPGEKVFLYTGVHGDELGRNWTLSERRFSETSFTQFDVSRRGSLEQAIGDHSLFIEELSVNNPAANLLLWHRPGTHVHAYCFGAVDELLLTMFDVPPVPVYLL